MALQMEGIPKLDTNTSPAFTTPSKRIEDGDDLAFFLSSTAYRDIKLWLFQLNRAVFPSKAEDGTIATCVLDLPPKYSPAVTSLRALLDSLSDLIKSAPPDTGPRRFGNVAFRKWFQLAEENVDELLEKHVTFTLDRFAQDSPSQRTALRNELKAYLLGGFGSAPRLDYGTGHELSFLAFLACLWKLDAFGSGEERAIVVGLISPYLVLVRTLIQTYTLEPAGSHGVWGLDDHSFLPYIFGSAQLGLPIPTKSTTPTPTSGSLPSAPPADSITSKPTVVSLAGSNMYFAAIQFIYDVKTGPFWEHSPTLFNISGIKAGWGKINKGMLKMWEAEVLGKFPVVQHFPFGSLFTWERDPLAVSSATVHSQQQPAASSKTAESAGTTAPWAKPSTAGSGSGMPATQAPWASAAGIGSAMPSTTAPWATATPMQSSGVAGMPPMRAPWAGSGSGGTRAPAPPSGRDRRP